MGHLKNLKFDPTKKRALQIQICICMVHSISAQTSQEGVKSVKPSTGKSLSEVLIFASTNAQYNDRLFIELQVQYMKIPSSEQGDNMLCTEIVFDIRNNLCTQLVLHMFCKNKSSRQRFTCS